MRVDDAEHARLRAVDRHARVERRAVAAFDRERADHADAVGADVEEPVEAAVACIAVDDAGDGQPRPVPATCTTAVSGKPRSTCETYGSRSPSAWRGYDEVDAGFFFERERAVDFNVDGP